MIIKPLTYSKSFLNGVSIWAIKVLPLMLPFFIISKMIVQLMCNHKSNTYQSKKKKNILIFFLSALSGYPMGAKLIYEQFKSRELSLCESKNMMAFCSVSGPMFMIGTVGVGFLGSFDAGLIILVSNIIGAIFNGLLWIKINKNSSCNNAKPLQPLLINNNTSSYSFSEIVYDSLISVLMIGTYIAISFVLIELLKQLNLIDLTSKIVYSLSFKMLNIDVIKSVIIGLFEVTCGVFNLAQSQTSLIAKTITSSFLISFGGFSILLQNLSMVSQIGITSKYILKQKITHAIFSIIIATLLCFCFSY